MILLRKCLKLILLAVVPMMAAGRLEAIPAQSTGATDCSYASAKVVNRLLPVFSNDPTTEDELDLLVIDIYIDASGQLREMTPATEHSREYYAELAPFLSEWEVRPAVYCDVPTSSLLRVHVDDYFYLKESREDEFSAPIPAFSFGEKIYDTLARVVSLWQEDWIEVEFGISETGSIENLKGLDQAGDVLVEKVFAQLKDRLPFKPATLSGEPVASSLILKLAAPQRRSANPDAEEDLDTELVLRELDEAWTGDEVLEFVMTGETGPNGLSSIELSDNVPPDIAFALARHARSFFVDAEQDVEWTVQLALLPGEKTPVIVSEPSLVQFQPPELKRHAAPEYPRKLLRDGVSGVASCLVVVNRDGRIESAELEAASHPDFGVEVMKVIHRWRFKPGMRNGEPVNVRVRIKCPFAAR